MASVAGHGAALGVEFDASGAEDSRAGGGLALSLGQVVFLPAAVRVTAASATPGAPAQPGQPALTGTSTTRAVTVPLDAAQQSLVKVGDKVIITLPDNQTTPGVISSVGKVATTPQGGGAPTISVQVTPTDPAATGSLDQAAVEVTIQPSNYQRLVEKRGLSHRAFERWHAAAMMAALLEPSGAR